MSISIDKLPVKNARASLGKVPFWDRIARKYAADPIVDVAGYEATLQRVRPLMSTDHDVLEIGCGTGTTALRLAPFTGRYLATDISPAMIAIANEKLALQPVPQLSFALADADASPFETASFDRILAFNLLHVVTNIEQTLATVARALRPGGIFISKTPCINEMNPLIRYLALPLMRMAGKAPPHVLCLDESVLRKSMTGQGFHLMSVERHGTRGRDFRVVIVAVKPPASGSL